MASLLWPNFISFHRFFLFTRASRLRRGWERQSNAQPGGATKRFVSSVDDEAISDFRWIFVKQENWISLLTLYSIGKCIISLKRYRKAILDCYFNYFWVDLFIWRIGRLALSTNSPRLLLIVCARTAQPNADNEAEMEDLRQADLMRSIPFIFYLTWREISQYLAHGPHMYLSLSSSCRFQNCCPWRKRNPIKSN